MTSKDFFFSNIYLSKLLINICHVPINAVNDHSVGAWALLLNWASPWVYIYFLCNPN